MPDLSEMYINLNLEEVDRGKLQMGQEVRVRVDAIPDKEFIGEIDFISPIASLVFQGRIHAGEDLPGPRHSEEPGRPAAARHEFHRPKSLSRGSRTCC